MDAPDIAKPHVAGTSLLQDDGEKEQHGVSAPPTEEDNTTAGRNITPETTITTTAVSSSFAAKVRRSKDKRCCTMNTDNTPKGEGELDAAGVREDAAVDLIALSKANAKVFDNQEAEEEEEDNISNYEKVEGWTDEGEEEDELSVESNTFHTYHDNMNSDGYNESIEGEEGAAAAFGEDVALDLLALSKVNSKVVFEKSQDEEEEEEYVSNNGTVKDVSSAFAMNTDNTPEGEGGVGVEGGEDAAVDLIALSKVNSKVFEENHEEEKDDISNIGYDPEEREDGDVDVEGGEDVALDLIALSKTNSNVWEENQEEEEDLSSMSTYNDGTDEGEGGGLSALLAAVSQVSSSPNLKSDTGKGAMGKLSAPRLTSKNKKSGKAAPIPADVVEYLKAWMMSPEHVAHPYPNEQEKLDIMADTGIESKQLTNWFVNNRKRFWKPRVLGVTPGDARKPEEEVDHQTQDEDEDSSVGSSTMYNLESEQIIRRGPSPQDQFPRKLFYILLREDKTGIISWMPRGIAFIIHDNDRFVSEILPRYFRHSKITSFQRQLSLYGFRRIIGGSSNGAYRHDMFKRDKPDLCQRIRKVKSNKQTLKYTTNNPVRFIHDGNGAVEVKRGRGRPVGSKNKPKVDPPNSLHPKLEVKEKKRSTVREMDEVNPYAKQYGKRGTTSVAYGQQDDPYAKQYDNSRGTTSVLESPQAVKSINSGSVSGTMHNPEKKRGRGRPKGSKNKTQIEPTNASKKQRISYMGKGSYLAKMEKINEADMKGKMPKNVTVTKSGKFQARFYHNGDAHYVGVFDTKEAAVAARDLAMERPSLEQKKAESELKGISLMPSGRKYQVRFYHNGGCHYVGVFDTKEDAIAARDLAEKNAGALPEKKKQTGRKELIDNPVNIFGSWDRAKHQLCSVPSSLASSAASHCKILQFTLLTHVGPLGVILDKREGGKSLTIQAVKPGSQADEVGIQVGDIPISSYNSATGIVAHIPYGAFYQRAKDKRQPVTFGVIRFSDGSGVGSTSDGNGVIISVNDTDFLPETLSCDAHMESGRKRSASADPHKSRLAKTTKTSKAETKGKTPRSVSKRSKYKKKEKKAKNEVINVSDKKRIESAVKTVNKRYGSEAERKRILSTTTFRGVTCRPSGKWQAQVYYAGKSRYIGVFQSKEQAALAYEAGRELLETYSEGGDDPDGETIASNVNLARKAAFAILK